MPTESRLEPWPFVLMAMLAAMIGAGTAFYRLPITIATR